MTGRIINQFGNVEEVSDRTFYEAVFGHPPRTKAERQAEWETGVERYIELILRGCELQSYGNPQVIEAKKRIAAGDRGACARGAARQEPRLLVPIEPAVPR